MVLGLILGCSLQAADWPGWRGVHRDGHAADPLPSTLESAPKPLWRKAVGHGYAGVVVANQWMVFLDDFTG